MNRFIPAIGLLLSLQVVVPSAHAADFNITVPINVRDFHPSIYEVVVKCSAHDGIRLIALSSGSAPISGGSFSGDITVRFDAFSGRDPATAATYSCNMHFRGRDPRTGAVVNYFSPSSVYRFPLARGQPFNRVSGPHPIP